uniref:Zinc finger BED domain-containing protein RICESLEEPER 1-like n=1 Tax=Elaeis guineensis var. tenera TaxID=51953 RepID=A0A6J0PE44_ELAGV|nr:zinc finger BED domain-containing protein RICESLEEPER 1-like [Elaeis guineensis]
MREWENSEHECLILMARPMREKFAKYWEECSLSLAIATVLDPRFKIDIVEYYYDQLYGSDSFDYIERVRTVMFDLYNEYGGDELLAGNSSYFMSSGSTNENTSASRGGVSLHDEHDFDEWYRRARSSTIRDSNKSELEKYLEEAVFPRKDNFDILNWWKMNSAQYLTLAKMARDILAIPATTVASESAFSVGGRVIDERRSCLAPEIVEALLTTSDWLESTKNDKF